MAKVTYYARVPGSKYIDPKGNDHYFCGGVNANEFTTEDADLQKELDGSIVCGNSHFFRTDAAAPKPQPKAYNAAQVAQEAVAAAMAAQNLGEADRLAKLKAAGGLLPEGQ